MQQALALEAQGGEGNEVAWAKGDAAEYEYEIEGIITWEPGEVTDVATDVVVLFDSDGKECQLRIRSDDAKLGRVNGEGPYLREGDRVTYLYGHTHEPGVVTTAETTVVVRFTSDNKADSFDLPDDKLRPPPAS